MADELDKLIDGALARYSSAEPLAGLEARIVRRVRAAEAARRRRWAWWLAIPAIASALLLVWTLRVPQPAPPVAKIVAPPPVRVETAPPPRVAAAAPRVRRRVVRPRREALPKRDVFPTFAPLSEQERLLVELAKSHPQALQWQPAGEIEVKPIEIAPLQIDGGQQR